VRAELDIYGLSASVSGWDEVVDAVRLDFAWFERPPEARRNAGLEIVVERRAPAFEELGDATAAFVTPRNVVFQQDGRTIVDYFGQAVSVFDRTAGRLRVQGENEHLVHEAVYQFLVSRAGEHLDGRGRPRLHGLGLVGAHGAVVLLLPSGGGKSTLALRALREDGVKLLSEDSPLIDRRGWLHPFPLRIGVNETDAKLVPAGRVRRIERMEFHPKLVLDVSAFADQIEATPQPLRHLVIGRRSLGRSARLEPVPRRRAIGVLLREAVVGVGLYQGMEFVLQRGMRDVVTKVDAFLMRSACCAAGLRSARVWRLVLGRDHEQNWAALRPLLFQGDASRDSQA
jgi:hypothetical protein